MAQTKPIEYLQSLTLLKQEERDKAQRVVDDLNHEINDLMQAIKLLQEGLGEQKYNGFISRNGETGAFRKKAGKTARKGRTRNTTFLTKYDKSATFEQKVVFAIHQAGKFLPAREIGVIMNRNEPTKSISHYITRFSALASRFRKHRSIVAIKGGGATRNTYYGLPDWLDGDGNIKSGFEYEQEQVEILELQ